MTKNCFLFAWFLVLRERVNPVPVFHHPQQGKSIFFKLCSVSQHIVEVYIFIAKAVFLKIGKMGKIIVIPQWEWKLSNHHRNIIGWKEGTYVKSKARTGDTDTWS